MTTYIREFEAVEEAKIELEWALEDLFSRIRLGNIDGLPDDVANLLPWLKSTSERPLPVYVGSMCRSLKKR